MAKYAGQLLEFKCLYTVCNQEYSIWKKKSTEKERGQL